MMITFPDGLQSIDQIDRFVPDGALALVELGERLAVYRWVPDSGGEYVIRFDFEARILEVPEDLPAERLAEIEARLVDRPAVVRKREKMRRYRARVVDLAGVRLVDLSAGQIKLLLGGLMIRNGAVEMNEADEMVVARPERWL